MKGSQWVFKVSEGFLGNKRPKLSSHIEFLVVVVFQRILVSTEYLVVQVDVVLQGSILWFLQSRAMILIQQVQTPHYTCSIQSLRGPNEYHHVLMYRNRPLVHTFLKCMLRTYDTILTVHFWLCTDNTVFLNNDIILQRFLARLLPMVLYRQLHSFHHLIICF